MNAVRSTCPYCGVGCGVLARRFGGAVEISGDESHPANGGRLCSKGTQLGATLDGPGGFDRPLVSGSETAWDEALDTVAARFLGVIREHGPDSLAFYVSGQLLTEDYYVANKLMKGAIGSANIDTNSRLCMASSVAGYLRAFGSDTVPCGYEDVELADLVILVGSNLAWCHPVLYQRLEAARRRPGGPALVVIDPRETPTAVGAELHLAIRPGTDAVLFNGLLSWLDEHGHIDRQFAKVATDGCAEALLAARSCGSPTDVAERCGLKPDDVRGFFELFAGSERTVTVYSQGVNQSLVGTDKVNSIINAHLATGRVGRPGTGPFSITGQPNAMGGREVGGLANQLAAHMGFEPENVDRVRRFWGFDRVASRPGLKAVELFDAIASRQVRAVWIMGTNPAVSMPRANEVRKALAGCDFVVVSDCVADTDTARYADVLLPAKGWGEKDGTVTNSERCISRQRAFVDRETGAKADWWIVSQVGARMGFSEQFAYRNSAGIFREHAALSAFENRGTRDFDIGALASLDDDAYESLEPTYWPCPVNGRKTTRPGDIFRTGYYFTANHKARFVPVRSHGTAAAASSEYPLLLNTGRIRDQWHTMTRTGLAPKLNRHDPEPVVELHPLDARRYGLAEHDLAEVWSRHGSGMFRVRLTRSVQIGHVFVPMHWSDRFASSARAGALITGSCDPHSGQPELKSEPVRVGSAGIAWHGLLLHRDGVAADRLSGAAYHARSCFEHCVVDFLGFAGQRGDWTDWANELLAAGDEQLTYEEPGSACIVASTGPSGLQWLFMASQRPRNSDAGWLASIFSESPLTADSRQAVLRGSPARVVAGRGDGATVCACHGTTSGEIESAAEGGCGTAVAVGSATGAGTNCGSCLPEIRRMVEGLRQ